MDASATAKLPATAKPSRVGGRLWFGRPATRIALGATLALAGMAGVGCDRAPSRQGLREWTAADHEHEAVQPQPRAEVDGGRLASTVSAIWQNQCALCHGVSGHGDGPQGPMFHAPDLTAEAWQAKVDDDAIGAVITTGRGRMPKFDLPPDITAGLVHHIRSLRGH